MPTSKPKQRKQWPSTSTYIRAGELARIAMGKVKYWGNPTKIDAATEDPLAWWCLTEAIVGISARRPKKK